MAKKKEEIEKVEEMNETKTKANKKEVAKKKAEKIKQEKIIPWRSSGHSIPPLTKKLSESLPAGRVGNHFSPVE